MSTEKLSKTEVIANLAKTSNLDKKAVGQVLEGLADLATDQLKNGSEFTIPGLIRLKTITKAATPERQGVNPFTKQPITIKAKPASKKVHAAPVKALKEAVQ